MIEANSKFVGTAALTNQQADTIIKDTLWPKWFSYFGVPRKLLSDGNVIRDLCKKLNITKMHSYSSPYHPERSIVYWFSQMNCKIQVCCRVGLDKKCQLTASAQDGLHPQTTMCEARGTTAEGWDLYGGS